jgi:glycerophosphoryl diester phosphodiesterase
MLIISFLFSACSTSPDAETRYLSKNTSPLKVVIAHRGASGYLPEHTLASKAMAYAQGADYIEQDLVMTKDNQVVVLHDVQLENVTNVAEVFINRQRKDGSYYVVDFTLEELRTLSVLERFKITDDGKKSVYAARFPMGKSRFYIHTFSEELELIQGLNSSMSNNIGIYPEIKNPAFHRREGKDISLAVLTILKAYGYTTKTDKVFLQCFDSNELQNIKDKVFPALNMDIKLVQLIGESKQFEWMLTEQGINKVARYADGIGPSMHQILDRHASSISIKTNRLVARAHAANLVVHPYTFRREAEQIPKYALDYNDLVNIYLYQLNVDGIFTDFPDIAVDIVRQHEIEK